MAGWAESGPNRLSSYERSNPISQSPERFVPQSSDLLRVCRADESRLAPMRGILVERHLFAQRANKRFASHQRGRALYRTQGRGGALWFASVGPGLCPTD